ncbi:MAG: hypothetical protein HKN76_00275, partial [Saprospiraceae bacterium]|nr:hypothetical protein [Saprospiraceae bacterium]
MKVIQLKHEDRFQSKPNHELIVIAENIISLENVGSIFRICEAMGVKKLFFAGTWPDLNNRKVKKTARSTQELVTHETIGSSSEIIPELRKEGYIIYALEITNGSLDIRTVGFLGSQKYV